MAGVTAIPMARPAARLSALAPHQVHRQGIVMGIRMATATAIPTATVTASLILQADTVTATPTVLATVSQTLLKASAMVGVTGSLMDHPAVLLSALAHPQVRPLDTAMVIRMATVMASPMAHPAVPLSDLVPHQVRPQDTAMGIRMAIPTATVTASLILQEATVTANPTVLAMVSLTLPKASAMVGVTATLMARPAALSNAFRHRTRPQDKAMGIRMAGVMAYLTNRPAVPWSDLVPHQARPQDKAMGIRMAIPTATVMASPILQEATVTATQTDLAMVNQTLPKVSVMAHLHPWEIRTVCRMVGPMEIAYRMETACQMNPPPALRMGRRHQTVIAFRMETQFPRKNLARRAT